MGGAEAADSLALASSLTYLHDDELGLLGRQLHGEREAGGETAFLAVAVRLFGGIFAAAREQLVNLKTTQGHVNLSFYLEAR